MIQSISTDVFLDQSINQLISMSLSGDWTPAVQLIYVSDRIKPKRSINTYNGLLSFQLYTLSTNSFSQT